jgi:tRNA-specific 2-thiouridylase
MARKRVAVAMSGGVDSSMAAAILRSQGHQVMGITMQLFAGSTAPEIARRVAQKLSIPHTVVDLSEVFSRKVVHYFCDEYHRGRTPNPCVVCNQFIKFDALLGKAQELDADFLATGHYARSEASANGLRLLKGIDSHKDQSYFLYVIGQSQLQRLMLPIGHMYKSEVKKDAIALGLPVDTSQESQDICFIPSGDYRSFVSQHVPLQPGDIVDTEDKVLGMHSGLACYTVGQRHGLGLPSEKRLYVIRLDTDNNRVVVGSEEALLSSWLLTHQLHWISGEPPRDLSEITAKIRYKSPSVAVSLYLENDGTWVCFNQSQRAIAPGQSIVFYRSEEVLGGGIIETLEAAYGG